MKTGKLRRWIFVCMVIALIVIMLPVVPGSVEANEGNATVLYIKDAPGAETKTVTEDMTVSENGWSWEQETATLTLNGFDGEYIEINGGVKIVLAGENSITIPAGATGDEAGIKLSSGGVTIVGNDDEERDSLFVGQTAFTSKPSIVYGIKAYGGVTIEDCDVSIEIAGDTSDVDKASSSRYGTWHNGGDVYVEGNASLDINIAGTKSTCVAVNSTVYTQSSGNIQLRVYDSDTTDDWVPSYVQGVYGLNASGSGTVSIDAADGKAITGRLVVKDTSGAIDLKGKVQLGNSTDSLSRTDFYYLAPNKKISQTESGKENVPCCLAYDYYDGTNRGVWLMDGEKNLVTQARISTAAENPLTLVDTTAVDIAAREVGDSGSYIYLTGLVSGGSGTYTYSWEDASAVPDYLSIRTDNGKYIGYMINTSPQKEYPAGTARIVVTDSLGATAYIDIAYGEVVNPPKNITVDGTTFGDNESASGTNWAYDAATKKITLNGYQGGVISSETDISLVLSGENQMILPAAPSEAVYGLKSEATITITGDGDENADSLAVIQTGMTTAKDVYAVYAKGNVTIEDCSVSVDVKAAEPSIDKASNQRYGIFQNGGDVYVTGKAELDIDLAGTINARAVTGTLYAQSSGSIQLRVYDSDTTDDWVPSYAEGVYGLNASGSGAVTIDVADGTTITGRLVAKDTCGTIDLKGKVRIGNSADFLGRTDFYYLAPNKKISQTESGKESVPCCLAYDYYDGTNKGVWLMDGEKNLVTQARISTVAENPLTFVDTAAVDIEAREVGDFSSWIYLTGLVSGGSGTYTYSWADASAVPDYLSIRTDSGNYIGYMIIASPQKEYPAGTARIVVTDSLGATAYIDINYGAVTVANPVTSVSLDVDEKILNIDETDVLEAVLTPEDATISDVTWASSNGNIVSVSNEGVIRAKTPGVATITVTTVQGGLKDTCKVYVKEATPQAVAGETHIEDLVPNADYSVSGSALTADAYGKIEINDAWREDTIDIIKTNAEPKCNSDVQQLYIPDESAVSIMTVSALVTLEYDETPYDGTMKEPTVTIEGLTQDVDYTISYEDNIDAGNASVVIAGKGSYFGSFKKTFKILPIKMTGITANAYSGVYDKMGHTFTLSGVPAGANVTYSETEDGYYSATKPTRVEAGETVVYFKVSLKNYEDYYGSTKITILPISITSKTATLSQTSFVYDGKAKTPSVTITDLEAGTDYTVAYANNINAGTAKAVVTGKGNYGGTIEKEFTITPASIEGKIVTLSQGSYTYDGTAKTPEVSVEGLKAGVDYSVAYANNINVGTATVTITGKGNYTGVLKKTFEIKEKPAPEPTLPQQGTTIKDATGVSYKVTKSDAKEGTVTYTKPSSNISGNITIPDTVTINGITYKITAIEANAFKNNKKITKVTIGNNIVTIGKNAFMGCSKLTSVTIGKNVKTIGTSAFSGCSKLKTLKLGSSLTTISDKAFYKCKLLAKVTIPAKVSQIGKSAFYGCKKLKSITFKTTELTSKKVGSKAFKGTPKNAVVKVPKESLKTYKQFLVKKGIHKKAKIKK